MGKIRRREFITASVSGITSFIYVPRQVLGGKGYRAPSDKLNIAGVGVGGMGRKNIESVANSENIVALCDVDWSYANKTFNVYPDAKRYKDYRIMLDEMGDAIDAVIIATPDHTHACVAM